MVGAPAAPRRRRCPNCPGLAPETEANPGAVRRRTHRTRPRHRAHSLPSVMLFCKPRTTRTSKPWTTYAARHPQRLRPAERDVRVEAQLLVLDQRQPREPARELRHRQLGLELAEARAQAVVDAAAEGEVAAGVVAVEVEGVGLGEDRRRRGRRPPATGRASRPRAARRRRRVAGRVVTRRQTQTDGSKRSVSSTAPGIAAGSATTRSQRARSSSRRRMTLPMR